MSTNLCNIHSAGLSTNECKSLVQERKVYIQVSSICYLNIQRKYQHRKKKSLFIQSNSTSIKEFFLNLLKVMQTLKVGHVNIWIVSSNLQI